MADYWNHWLEIGQKAGAKLPKIYNVNWFRKSDGGDFLWPGFGENGRVLKWVFERCEGTAKAVETPIGNLPQEGDLDIATAWTSTPKTWLSCSASTWTAGSASCR